MCEDGIDITGTSDIGHYHQVQTWMKNLRISRLVWLNVLFADVFQFQKWLQFSHMEWRRHHTESELRNMSGLWNYDYDMIWRHFQRIGRID